jgi:methyl-accepting chemotaxis protein
VVAALNQTLSSTEQIALGVGIVAVLTLIGSAAYGSFAIARPMRKMAHVLSTLSKDHNIDVPYTTRGDEVGRVGASSARSTRFGGQIRKIGPRRTCFPAPSGKPLMEII